VGLSEPITKPANRNGMVINPYSVLPNWLEVTLEASRVRPVPGWLSFSVEERDRSASSRGLSVAG
jgi:hypothetical protein